MTVQMSYLDRSAIRRVIVNTSDHTIEINLIDGEICVDGKVEKIPVEQDFSYFSMHQTYLYGVSSDLCSVEEGLGVLNIIDRAELANRTSTWVSV